MRPVPNLTLRREDGRVVAESVTVADSTLRRLRGLLGRRDLPSGHGVLLRPAWSIHTAFMRFPIDVVFLDPDQVVIKIVPNLTPFSTASCRGAREIVELRAGESERRGLALGDRVAWAARPADERVPGDPAIGEFDTERRGVVVLASGDQRYLKLVRFLLDGKGIDVAASVSPQSVAEAVGGEGADVAVIDTDAVGEGLRLANITRARRPETTVVLVGDDPPEQPLAGLKVYRKWDDTEGVVAAIEDALEQKAGTTNA